jgi:putative FmdB family regulatory protein
MPLYDYYCERCGAFEQQRPLSQAGEPVPCPSCQALAQRVITAPFLATMKSSTRKAHERNERSAHEPQVIRREPPVHEHGGPHHHHPHRHRQRAHRPWMIGH